MQKGIILDVSGFQALKEEGEVSAANITTTTMTNATDSNATVVTTTTPISPAETGQENATTTIAATKEEQ
jgi:hypothetical protein